MVRGKILHSLIEARIEGQPWEPVMKQFQKDFDKLFKEEKDEIGDLPDEVRRMFQGYIKRYEGEDLKYLKLKKKRAEFEFEVPLVKGVHMHGLIDTVPEDSRGRVWVMEHKTHKIFPSESARFTDIQTVMYTWVAPQMGFPKPNGVLWDYIRTKAPTIPKLLANGKGLSVAQGIDTDYDTYFAEITKHGFDPKDYKEILDKLKGRDEAFYKRIYMPAPGRIVDPIMNDVRETAMEIKILGEYSKTRNITKDCSWCSYFSICQAELRGLDSDFIRKAEYKLKDKRDKKEEANGSEEPQD